MSGKHIGPVVSGKQRGMRPVAVFVVADGKHIRITDVPDPKDKNNRGKYQGQQNPGVFDLYVSHSSNS